MGKDVVDFNVDDTTPTNTGHVIVAINVENFMPVDKFKLKVDELVQDIRNSRRLPGVERIRLPGDGSVAARMDRLEHGVPVPPALRASLDQLAAELKIAPLA